MLLLQISYLGIRKNFFECLVKYILFVYEDTENRIDIPLSVGRVEVVVFDGIAKTEEFAFDICLAILAYRFQQIWISLWNLNSGSSQPGIKTCCSYLC